MNSKVLISLFLAFSGAVLSTGCSNGNPGDIPESWKQLVKAEGQYFPIPESWISTPEGAIAHSIRLPDSVPKPVPFDFEKAEGPIYWPNKRSEVELAYFDHLCKTEAGEWTFRIANDVEGLYFARPINGPGDDYLGDLYAPEAPWVESAFQLFGDTPKDRGWQFVSPPLYNYTYVEEPKRDTEWQEDIVEPYIRLFGYTTAIFAMPGHVVEARNELTPMQVIGIEKPTARYAYTWRGITRPRDRELHIAGGELIIYDRTTYEVLSVSRTFQLTGRNRRRPYGATWLVSPVCREGIDARGGRYISEYAQRILQ